MGQYLGYFKSRKSIAAFLIDGVGLVAGMWVETGAGSVLRDSSGDMPLSAEQRALLPGQAPAWLAFEQGDGPPKLLFHQPLQPDKVLDKALTNHGFKRKRLQIYGAIRHFFHTRTFLEVDTPVAVLNPGTEPFLDTFPVGDLWLRTSPELHMKRLLGEGFDQIFQMGACFRRGDVGSWHREEFTMLEWYRCFADLDKIAEDVAAMLAELSHLAEDPVYFQTPPEHVTCVELFQRHLNLQLRDCSHRQPLQKALEDRGIGVDPEDDWDTLYFLLFLNFIEPYLGADRPVMVSGYPASQAALAKLAPVEPGKMPTCYRMEVYLRGGLELANGFYELTDENEQRQRFAEDAAKRKAMNKAVYANDEAFLASLGRGLPPCAGIALGVDRLVAALLNQPSLKNILPFESQ